jgi:tRNA A37 methylthiotransferase MiaB
VVEFLNGLENGFNEFSLIGTDLGSYGRGLGCDLAMMLRTILQIKGDYKIWIRNLNPEFLIEMLPDLKKIFRSGKIEHLSSAVQSGSDHILKLMNRHYKVNDFIRSISALKSEYPPLKIRTQLMCGFPGETDEDFSGTMKILDSKIFNCIETFRYSPRLNTAAKELGNQVKPEVMKQRGRRLVLKSLTSTSINNFRNRRHVQSSSFY